MDLLEADDVAYLVNAIRSNTELRIRAEMRQPKGYGESWPELARLLRRLIARRFGR